MQDKPNNSQQIQDCCFSTHVEMSDFVSIDKSNTKFLASMTNQTQNQREQSDLDYREVIDYDDLSKECKEEKYLNLAKIIQKKQITQKQLEMAKTKLKIQVEKKQKIINQLQNLKKIRQLEEDSNKNLLDNQLKSLKDQILYQQEIKSGLKSELIAWLNLNKLQQDQIQAFPVQLRDQLNVMEKNKLSLSKQRQKITQLLALQEIFMENIEQIMLEFP